MNVIKMLYICIQNIIYNMETALASKKQTAFRLDCTLLERLKVLARKEHRSLNNYVECVLMDVAYNEPNEETIAAIKEAKSGKDLETFDLNALKEYVASL